MSNKQLIGGDFYEINPTDKSGGLRSKNRDDFRLPFSANYPSDKETKVGFNLLRLRYHRLLINLGLVQLRTRLRFLQNWSEFPNVTSNNFYCLI